MDIKYINPFLNSFLNVLPQLGLNDIKKNKVDIKGKEIESTGVIIILGVIGDIKGNIIYTTNMDGAKAIASKMMMGMPVLELDEMAQSAISELTNMLTANAATLLAEDGINIDISTPTLVYGDFTANASVDKVICIEMLVEGLPFEVNISLENAK
ncbi:chemotaxis protein CheX [Clostridium sp. 19966]|uniref:chemotaxis protein CheX n=1 Tax=Clostridium sp. 19966 TaxID=2768166 RepID=UPI0028DE1D5C|nr:chemotaxis protein CheX [Clostridium sp. 19966]MDT8715179.1 chemotaxis protein CheX [Clostridium sp. 19966]